MNIFRRSPIRFLFSAIVGLTLATSACNNTVHSAALPTPPPAHRTTLRAAGAAKRIILGTAATPSHLDEPLYASTLAEQFLQLEPENQMKFGVIHPRAGNDASAYDFAHADRLVSFAQQHNMLVRGHCFVWHQQVAAWVTEGIANRTYDPAALSAILQNHISTVARHYAGKVWAWDVVNEAFTDNGSLRNTVWYDAPGIGLSGRGTAYIEQAFRWARAADPAAKLFYNDYDAETVNTKSDAIYAMAKDFRSRGVPLDGIGFQAHIKLKFNDPTTLRSFATNLKRFSDLGLEIHITELDIALDSNDARSLAAQGDLYGKVAAICLQNSSCHVLQTWGFTDKYSWIPSFSKGKQGWALPLDANYNQKPAFTFLLETLQSSR
jgi:endo-1,4-beta-xylanase